MTGPAAGRIVFALCSRDIPSETSALTSAKTWRLIGTAERTGRDLADLIAEPSLWPSELGSDVRERARSRLKLIPAAEAVLAAYASRGLWAITACDEFYPARLRERLGDAAPCLLHGAGPVSLLREDGLAVVGSRNLTPEGEAAARGIADIAVGERLSVISGGARGADQTAMGRAIERGGTAVGVLAHPLDRLVQRQATHAQIDDGLLCLISPFKPEAPFTVAAAMARNRVIYGLARVTCVVASDLDRGGTWRGATEALARRYGTVAAWLGAGAGPGNEALVARGAHPVAKPPELLELGPVPPREDQLPLEVTTPTS